MYRAYDQHNTLIAINEDYSTLVKDVKRYLLEEYLSIGYQKSYCDVMNDDQKVLTIYPAIRFNECYFENKIPLA